LAHLISPVGIDLQNGRIFDLNLDMAKRVSIIFIVICPLVIGSCGPDLDPKKYWVKSILLSSYEEYDFTYKAGKLEKIVGTDLTSWDYRYYSDSITISGKGSSGSVFQNITLSYSGGKLSKWKTKWRFSGSWYSDSVQFAYSGSKLSLITYKKANYLVTMQDGNLTGMSRSLGLAQYDNSFDTSSNPFERLSWIDPFLKINGFNSSLKTNSIVRFFSKNNLLLSTKTILGVKETERYSYIYLHGILPKSINLDVQSSTGNFENIVFVFDIQYAPREGTTF
jgi:hypothetical protein